MKKILCLALALMMLLSFAACKDEGKETGGNAGEEMVVDEKTVSIVNNAFTETENAIKSATALGIERNIILNITAEGKTTSSRSGFGCTFIKDGASLKIAGETAITGDAVDVKAVYYSDGTTAYASTADTTYLITANDDLKAYLEGLTVIDEKSDVFNSSSVEPINTRIVNTSVKGYGFILDYPTDKLPEDFQNFFGDSLARFGDTVKPQGLKISGIIDEKGRLTNETVTYTFTYDYEVEVVSDADPDNPSTDTEPKKETRTATVELSAQLVFEYGVTEIELPDEIELPQSDGGEDGDDKPALKELSITDFNKLVAEETVKDATDKTDDSDDSDE